jgi:hypothetical protein
MECRDDPGCGAATPIAPLIGGLAGFLYVFGRQQVILSLCLAGELEPFLGYREQHRAMVFGHCLFGKLDAFAGMFSILSRRAHGSHLHDQAQGENWRFDSKAQFVCQEGCRAAQYVIF